MGVEKGFDGDAFYRTLRGVALRREKTWKQVASETGVSASTLTRMAQGRRPDASSLAALSAWAGINPSDFVSGPFREATNDPMGRISSLLRTDPTLDAKAAEALDAIVRAAYERLRKASD